MQDKADHRLHLWVHKCTARNYFCIKYREGKQFTDDENLGSIEFKNERGARLRLGSDTAGQYDLFP